MPAKRKQASLKKTKSTTTYKRGGAKKKMMGGGAAKAMKKRVYQKGGASGAKKFIGTLDLSKAGTGRPGKKTTGKLAKAAKSALGKAAGKTATKAGKKRIGTLDLSKPNKKMQAGGTIPGRNIAAPKGAKGIKRATLTKPRKADGSIDYSKMGKGAKLENPGKTASKREMKKFFKKAKRMQDGGMAPMPPMAARDRRGVRPGTGLIMDPGALMPGETGPITEGQANTRAMMEGMKGGRDYTPFRSQADSMRTALEEYRDAGRPGSEMNPIEMPQVNIPAQQQGGRVLNGKALRNNSRGRARKNR